MAERLRVNEGYAERYNVWREKEELQKLKNKYADDDESSSDSETEDDNAEALTEQLDRDWFRTLAAVKKRDPKIYDKKATFYQSDTDASDDTPTKTTKKRKSKPLFIKDYERKLILEKDGIPDDDSYDGDAFTVVHQPSYYEEQEEIKQSFMKATEESDSEEELLTRRDKGGGEQKVTYCETRDYTEGLNDRKELPKEEGPVNNPPLKSNWNDTNPSEGESFLKDYILNQRYKHRDDQDDASSAHHLLDDQDLLDDEKETEKQDEFERKYNFRFEEPDQEFIKSYPRTVSDSMRRKDSRRSEKRKEVHERKTQEKEKRKSELKQLKNLKRKEILGKLDKIKEITGNTSVGFSHEDLVNDFDPETYDKQMKEMFDDKYYGETGVDAKKPVFAEDDADVQLENWDDWTGCHGDGAEELPSCEDSSFNMDADYDPSNNPGTSKLSKRDKRKRKSKFSQVLGSEKPVFDPSQESYEQYLDEYYKLDYEDVVADIPCRFKYRKVVPNDFGLSTEEVLSAHDRELNTWVSLKKTSQYRSTEEEEHDVTVYKRKARNWVKKQKILISLTEPEQSGEDGVGNLSPGLEPTRCEDERENSVKGSVKTSVKGSVKTRKKSHGHEGSSKVSESGVKTEAKNATDKSDTGRSGKARKKKKSHEITDERLEAYGINPKKFRYRKHKEQNSME